MSAVVAMILTHQVNCTVALKGSSGVGKENSVNDGTRQAFWCLGNYPNKSVFVGVCVVCLRIFTEGFLDLMLSRNENAVFIVAIEIKR